MTANSAALSVEIFAGASKAYNRIVFSMSSLAAMMIIARVVMDRYDR